MFEVDIEDVFCVVCYYFEECGNLYLENCICVVDCDSCGNICDVICIDCCGKCCIKCLEGWDNVFFFVVFYNVFGEKIFDGVFLLEF